MIETKQKSSERVDLSVPAIRVAPSLLSADFANLVKDLRKIEGAGAQVLHLDVMDGHFVPNISFGPPVIASLRKQTGLFFDTHLMISEPGRYAEAFVKAGSDHITFHIEAADKPDETIREIKRLGAGAGISLNPGTPVSAIEAVLADVDMVLVMSVRPGFGGQSFMADVLEKVRAIKQRLSPRQRLEIDGGIDMETIVAAARAGADTFVAGTAVFRRTDPAAAFAELQDLAESASIDR